MQKQPSKGFFEESVMRNFAKFTRKHLFCRTRPGDCIIAVSIVVKGELANENLNHDTKTKAYVPI